MSQIIKKILIPVMIIAILLNIVGCGNSNVTNKKKKDTDYKDGVFTLEKNHKYSLYVLDEGFKEEAIPNEYKKMSSKELLDTESSAIIYTFGEEFQETKYKAYNGFVDKTKYSNFKDAQNFVAGLNKYNIDGTNTWRLLFSEEEVRKWHETTFGSVSGTDGNSERGMEATLGGYVPEIWIQTMKGDKGYYWSIFGVGMIAVEVTEATDARGFVIVRDAD